MSATLWGWLVGAVLLFWVIGAYNRLVRLRSQAAQGFGIFDERLRQLMVFSGTPAHDGRDMTDTTDLAALTELTGELTQALARARAHPFEISVVQALTRAYEAWAHGWTAAHTADLPVTEPVVREGGPSWRALFLQVEVARQEFNQRIDQYNTAVRQFPAIVLARLLGLKAAQVI